MATEAWFAVRDGEGDSLIGPGDIVELRERQISRFISGHGLVFVIRTKPLFSGNEQGDVDPVHKHAIVLTGYTPVRCRGRVCAGDALLPSGLSDGTAVASQTAPSRIIAMESSEDGLGMILALIYAGLPQIPLRASRMQPSLICEEEFVAIDSTQLNGNEIAKADDSLNDSTPRRCTYDYDLHRQVFELRAENLVLQAQVKQMRKTIAIAFRRYASEILACPLQSLVRVFLARRASARALRSVLKLQAACRFCLAKAYFLHIKCSVLILQSLARGRSAHRNFATKCKAARWLQALARMRSDREGYRRSVALILRIHSILRCASCRREYIIAQDAVRLIQACARRSKISRTTALGRLLASLRVVARAEDDLPSMIRTLEQCHVTARGPIEQCACSNMSSVPCEGALASTSGGLTCLGPETCCVANRSHENDISSKDIWHRDRTCYRTNGEMARPKDSSFSFLSGAEERQRVLNSTQEDPAPSWPENPHAVVGNSVASEPIAATLPQIASNCSQLSMSEHRAADNTLYLCASDGFDRAIADKFWRDTLTLGNKLDARLFGSKWYDSIVVGVDAKKGLKVHFMGWSTKWDMSML